MAIDTAGALAAMNAGLAAGTSPTEDPADETTTDETTTSGTGEDTSTGAEDTGAGGDGSDAGGADGEQPGGETDDATGAEGGETTGDERPRGPDGKFLPKDAAAAAKPAASADGAALGPDGKPLPKAPAAGPKDAINDPIPQGLKKETHERMQALITTAKTLTTERDAAVTQRDEILGYITESTASPEQYGQALDYIRMVNSSDPAQLDKCIDFMQGELIALCKMRGRPVPGVDLVSEHEDLRQEIADGKITRQRAEEIAAARAQDALRTSQAAHTQTNQQAQQQYQTAARAAMAELNTLEAQLKTQDAAQYAAKRQLVLAALKTPRQDGKTPMQKTHPSQWVALFTRTYLTTKVPAAPRPAAKPGVKPGQKPGQPLRARTPAGAQTTVPASPLEAMNAGLASMGR